MIWRKAEGVMIIKKKKIAGIGRSEKPRWRSDIWAEP